jgi:putative SOS response-associated peptidase YedK
LIPFAAKDKRSAAPLINARLETVVIKPAFRSGWKARRCLIPTSGVCEWSTVEVSGWATHILCRALGAPGQGQPVEFHYPYDRACDGIRELHDRMRVMLGADGIEEWLRVSCLLQIASTKKKDQHGMVVFHVIVAISLHFSEKRQMITTFYFSTACFLVDCCF